MKNRVMFTCTRATVVITIATLLAALLALAPGASAQTVTKTITVGTSPWGVGVNVKTNKVYVVNVHSNNVSVINGSTDKVTKAITVGNTPMDVGINAATNKVYVTNWNSNNISVINGSTNKVTKTVAVGNNPQGIGVNVATNKVYVVNNGSNSVTVINGSTDTVAKTVAMGGFGDIGVNSATNKVYVVNNGGHSVFVMNGSTDTVTKTVAVGNSPNGVGVNTATNKVFVGNSMSNNVSVIDGSTDTVTKTIAVGTNPVSVGINTTTNRAYVANLLDNNVSVVDGSSYKVTKTVAVGSKPEGVGVNAATNKVYVANGESNNVSVIYDSANNSTASTWYLAEGSTAWGFICSIGIMNPNPTDVTVKVTYMTDTGQVDGGTYKANAMSAGYVYPKDILGEKDFSTKVECLEKKQIAVDRNMFFSSSSDTNIFEGHASVGVNAPAKQWYLPEGSSDWGFECWLLIQNPNSSRAVCDVTYMIEGEGPKTIAHTIPARSRKTFNMADDIGNKDASISVKTNVPVIPERAMYRSDRREGHESIGTTAPAQDYYLAEGTTAWGFTTYVLVQNPQSSPNNVDITYMTPNGPKQQPSFTMPANSRTTIRVNDVAGVANTDLSTRVHGSKPLIAERAMYWVGGMEGEQAQVCHDSIGMAEPHKYFYLPSGDTGQDYGAETYTLVQNLNTSPVKVRVTYVTGTGKGNAKFDATIPAQSRKTFNMADRVSAGNYGIIVQSLTTGKKIMVERAMYWNLRGAGTDTIGGYSD